MVSQPTAGASDDATTRWWAHIELQVRADVHPSMFSAVERAMAARQFACHSFEQSIFITASFHGDVASVGLAMTELESSLQGELPNLWHVESRLEPRTSDGDATTLSAPVRLRVASD